MNKSDRARANSYVKLLKQGKKRLQLRNYSSILFIFAAVFLLLLALLSLAEYVLYLHSSIKTASLLIVFLISIIASWLLFNQTGYKSFETFYRHFCDTMNAEALKYLLDFQYFQRFKHSPLYEAATRQNLSQLSAQDIEKKISAFIQKHPVSSTFRRSITALGLSSLFYGILFLFVSSGFVRTLSFWQTFVKPNPYTYQVTPGNTVVEQGSSFKPTITFERTQIPQTVLLAIKTEVENEYRLQQMNKLNDTTFTLSGIILNNNIRYYIEMDGYQSQTFNANVQLRPRFDLLSANIEPPAYTRLQPTNQMYPFSAIRGYEGSILTLKGSVNKNVEYLELIKAQQADSISLNVGENDQTFTYKMKINAPDTLYFSMKDRSGLKNKNPFSFTINPIEDEYPYVSILHPESQLSLIQPNTIDVSYEATDDFGLTKATLFIELQKAFVDKTQTITVNIPIPAGNNTASYTWNVKTLNMKPRDKAVYWIEVRDNDQVHGFKTAASQKLAIRIPSMTEHFNEIEEQESHTQNALDKASESYKKIQQEYESFKNKLKEGDDNKWDQNRKLEEIKQQREDLNKQVDKLNKEFEKLRKNLEKENMLSNETLETYKELEKLMKEIDDPEVMKMLEELQNSLQQFNQNQLQEAMKKLEFNEKAYQERLQRTLELFKQLKLNSDLEKLARSLENMSEQEKQLMESDESDQQKAQQQEAIKNDLDKLDENIEELDKNTNSDNQDLINQLQQQSKQEIQDIQKKLKENIEQLKNSQSKGRQQNSSQKIRQQQQQIQQQMQQTAQKMRETRKEMSRQQQRINVAALENILYSLLEQSKEQETLTIETNELALRSRGFVEKARIQKNIANQFIQISDSLTAAASEIPQLSNQITEKKLEIEQNLNKAVEQLSERDRRQSTIAERQALGGINQLASMIASLIDQLNSQNGQGGGAGSMSAQQMMQQMQNMSGQQQQLNQQLQQMINDIQGQRLTQDQMERLNQLARQQNRIRKQMEELRKNGALEPGDKLLSEMQRMAEEMEKAINDIRGGAVDEPTIERQQNILSRMLEAEKALQERGKSEKEREAKTAEELPEGVSPNVTLEELQKMIRQRLQDPDQTTFSSDYQKLIEMYFKLLQEQENINSMP